MTKSPVDRSVREPDAVEALLAQAQPRAVPPAEAWRLVRRAVYDEWRDTTGQRRSRQRMLRFAVAASVLVAVFASFSVFRDAGIAGLEVAAISKSHGTIYLLGERSELTELSTLESIVVGQTIVTGQDAGIGLEWYRGGSLRIDAATTVEFLAADSIQLREGRVYFDSTAQGNVANFTIDTAHGDIHHVGTQYMAAVDALTLVVSVREGVVTVSRRMGEERATAGQRLEFIGDARPGLSNISATAAQWAWVEATAPTLDFSGKSTHEFLQWVGRETGYRVAFDSTEAEQVARDGRLVGTIPGLDPRGELEVRMLGEDLDYDFDDARGTLNISTITPGN